MSKDLAAYAKKNGIKYFMISYTDLFGGQRAKLVPAQAISTMPSNAIEKSRFIFFLLKIHPS